MTPIVSGVDRQDLVSPEIKAKIFDPFFTTKAVGKGTGLGMGICFKIVEQHQGSIAVETAVGHGTEFIITLPLESSTTEVNSGIFLYLY